MRTILVSGASGIVGYGVLKSLRGQGIKLIGTTIYPESAANCFSDVFEQAPKTSDPKYLDWLQELIRIHNIDMIIPCIEDDMILWNKHREELCTLTFPMLNTGSLITACTDKWMFYEKLVEHDSPYRIETTLETDFNALINRFGLPFLLKPRCGFASKGIVKVTDKATFDAHKNDIGTVLMAQPIMGDTEHEYTVSAFFDADSHLCCHHQLRRKLSQTGFTEIAETVELDNIEIVLTDLASIFHPVGPTIFQFREDGGILKLLEINPRVSSSTSIRTAFGYNEVLMSITYFLDGKKPTQPILKSGKAIRYTEDFICFNQEAQY